jgi:Tfp pilus assembly protein PilO
MNLTRFDFLGQWTSRQVNLLLAGVIVTGAALFWTAMKSPISSLRVLHAERIKLERSVVDGATLIRRRDELKSRNAALERALQQVDLSQRPDRFLVDLLGKVDRSADRFHVRLRGIAPAPSRRTLGLEELPFDLEASGDYAALANWMADIEDTLPGLSIVRFEFQPGGPGFLRQLKLRVAAYRSTGAAP